jgi:hypothetical protein
MLVIVKQLLKAAAAAHGSVGAIAAGHAVANVPPCVYITAASISAMHRAAV